MKNSEIETQEMKVRIVVKALRDMGHISKAEVIETYMLMVHPLKSVNKDYEDLKAKVETLLKHPLMREFKSIIDEVAS